MFQSIFQCKERKVLTSDYIIRVPVGSLIRSIIEKMIKITFLHLVFVVFYAKLYNRVNKTFIKLFI
jgi:hypothetical protein